MTDAADKRARAFFLWLVEQGGIRRYGPNWAIPERRERVEEECRVILRLGFHAAFIMLADIMDFARRERIPYGPGRGSVGGCYVGFLTGIHEVDSLEYDLLFERFLNEERVSFPDVDLDFSQRDRPRIFDYVRQKYTRDGQVVLQVGAIARMTARAVVDTMAAAVAHEDQNAYATATNLKKCFPKGPVSGGVKVERELAYWLDGEGGHGDRDEFRRIAEQAGWYDRLRAIDGCGTHLAKHAAGVVILREEDLPYLPQTGAKDSKSGEWRMMTGFDMYALDDLDYLKWDILGLRTLDVVTEAHKFEGGDGSIPALMDLWHEHRDDPGPYEALCDGETLGIFQMETEGYRHTLREFQPSCFDDLVALVALYRPGALDYREEDVPEGHKARNMVELFIDRHHGKEPATYPHKSLKPVLESTHGIFVYQEQQMQAARLFAGFTLKQADALRKAIGKKRPAEMAQLVPIWEKGTADKEPAVAARVWKNIEAASRYSWNKSHAVEYAIITWWTAWFKWVGPGFYAAEINSWQEDRERQANVISAARQHFTLRPPDINLADNGFIVDQGDIVFGLNGVIGMGEANRAAILNDRWLHGPFASFEDFCARLGGVPTNMKRALVACGAFDTLGVDRRRLLSIIPKGNQRWDVTLNCGCVSTKQSEPEVGLSLRCNKHKRQTIVTAVEPIPRKRWTVLEHINDAAKSGKDRPLPGITEWEIPTDAQLAAAELEAMGYYISNVPLAEVSAALGRLPRNHYGGEIDAVRVKTDKNGNEMAFLTVVTPELRKQRMLIFASNWDSLRHKIEKGKQLIFRGLADDDTVKIDAVFEPSDVRQFKKVRVWKDGDDPTVQEFDGQLSTLRDLESHGYRVRLL